MTAYLDASAILPILIEEAGSKAPDALHAAVCRREDLLLVTLDKRLALADEELGVRTALLS